MFHSNSGQLWPAENNFWSDIQVKRLSLEGLTKKKRFWFFSVGGADILQILWLDWFIWMWLGWKGLKKLGTGIVFEHYLQITLARIPV